MSQAIAESRELARTGESESIEPEKSESARTIRNRESLANSRIQRDGLPNGTEAPLFQLPSLTGGKRSLKEFRGRKVLLVFSDPECGPCDLLAPELEKLSRRVPNIQVVMVSRGDREKNLAKAQAHGFTFTVLLQKRWEISRLYAMFATPIAYLIDEAGVIAADVALGSNAIINLLISTGILELLDAKRTISVESDEVVTDNSITS